MSAKQILSHEEARQKLERGANLLANAVKGTLGPRGRNVLLQNRFGGPTVTKDGVTVAKEIEIEDRLENLGAQFVKEVASRTNEVAGDGTTTATVLAQAMLHEGLRQVTAGANPMLLKRGIDKAVTVLVAGIEKMSQPVETREHTAQVGAIAANNDPLIGELLAEAMEMVGKDGVITVEESRTVDTDLEHVEGMQFDNGYISPYFVTDPETMSATFEEPNLLLVDGKIASISEILPVLEKAIGTQRPLVVIADNVEGEALATLVVNKLRGTFHCAAVKAPGFGERRRETMKDLAVLTGAQVVSQELGQKLDQVGLEVLGSARSISMTKDSTTITGGKGAEHEIKARLAEMKVAIENCESDYEREKIQERLAKLVGGVAVIRVGATTETELKEKKHRLEDALSATRAAVEEGIVPGGGTAYINLLYLLEELDLEGDEKLGVAIVMKAIQAPLSVIADNSGAVGAVIVENVKSFVKGIGYDAVSRDYVDMVGSGIVDPAKVVRVALQNAASIASMVLTTETVIADAPSNRVA